ncbi:pyridoxal phosphatase [Conservatibacter flavescens]|uniref:Pyridoxal phosphatase n=1 Tax=Conservatibacter flavescens TaxID=28161 RepID=A0A2M8S2D4_9PAST|nr:pyridoxal phosphatase [Conservatibacter flavescens]PJG85320.1 pyridoxal phosphatase [Conservatibacter flavescens]
MTYKVIAFDLDGTLLNSQGQILASSKQAIAEAIKQGLKIVFVTGRHHTAAKPYHYELNLDTPIICCNGTYLYDVQNDTTPLANPLSAEQAYKIIEVAEKYGLHLLMYSRDHMNYSSLNAHMQKFAQWVQSCPEHVRPQIREVHNFHELLKGQETIWKFVISHPDKDTMNQAVSELSPEEFSCEWSWIDRVDISNNGNTKGKRLLELLNQWGVSPEDVIAFGDNHNDISMLKAVGLGVAMGNAEEEAKKTAKIITLSNNEDGIANVLTTYL